MDKSGKNVPSNPLFPIFGQPPTVAFTVLAQLFGPRSKLEANFTVSIMVVEGGLTVLSISASKVCFN